MLVLTSDNKISTTLLNIIFSGIVGVDDPEKIETMANENDYNSNSSQSIVFGGVIFQSINDESDLKNINYTLRLRTEFVQKLSNFLYMPYSFSGPQAWGQQYDLFCSLQTPPISEAQKSFQSKVTHDTLTEKVVEIVVSLLLGILL